MAALGQRGHSWGNPDWDKIALTRAVGAWFDDGTGVRRCRPSARSRPTTTPTRPTGRAMLDPERTLTVDEPRLSTTSDEAGRQIRAGLELWVGEDDDYPLRGVGEVLAGSTLELGALRLDVAFFGWHIEGRARDRPLRHPAPRVIKAVISDFGGVITQPADRRLHPRARGARHPGRGRSARRWRHRRRARRRAAAVDARARPDDRARVHRRARGDPRRGARPRPSSSTATAAA